MATIFDRHSLPDGAYTVFHYGFPPLTLFGRDKLFDWLDIVAPACGVESVCGPGGTYVVGTPYVDPGQELPAIHLGRRYTDFSPQPVA